MDVRFSTYAVPMVIGEIRRYLRDNNSVRVSRSMRDTAYKAMQIKERVTGERGREPDIEEIAKELGVPKEDVVLALEAIAEPVSLYEAVYSDGGDTIYVMDQIGDNNDDSNWLDEILLREENPVLHEFLLVEKQYCSSLIRELSENEDIPHVFVRMEEVKTDLALSDRSYRCECGCEMDRDLNAAINIRMETMRLKAS